jgi:hypothetical protein
MFVTSGSVGFAVVLRPRPAGFQDSWTESAFFTVFVTFCRKELGASSGARNAPAPHEAVGLAAALRHQPVGCREPSSFRGRPSVRNRRGARRRSRSGRAGRIRVPRYRPARARLSSIVIVIIYRYGIPTGRSFCLSSLCQPTLRSALSGHFRRRKAPKQTVEPLRQDVKKMTVASPPRMQSCRSSGTASPTTRAGNRRKGLLSALRAHANTSPRTDLLWKTRRGLDHPPGRARTERWPTSAGGQ